MSPITEECPFKNWDKVCPNKNHTFQYLCNVEAHFLLNWNKLYKPFYPAEESFNKPFIRSRLIL
jgi:hypothetical protein